VKLSNYLEFIKEGLITTQPAEIVLDKVGFLPKNLIYQSDMTNVIQYNKDYLIKNMEFIQSIEIKFESKFDLEVEIPKKLFHLSIREFGNSILKYGLSPKSKSKISYHDSRIYVCKHLINCKSLITNMKMIYNQQKWSNPKSKIDDRWVIYEIDTEGLEIRLYTDPNYVGGYYLLSNIPVSSLKVIEKEN
jgi:hypothetical protein